MLRIIFIVCKKEDLFLWVQEIPECELSTDFDHKNCNVHYLCWQPSVTCFDIACISNLSRNITVITMVNLFVVMYIKKISSL